MPEVTVNATALRNFTPPRKGMAIDATPAGAPADPFAGLLDALAARLAPLVADLVAERLATPVPAADPPPGTLVDKGAIAKALSIGSATVDRMVRAGMPYERVNARKRFDVQACRAWAAARGRHPTTAPRRTTAKDHALEAEVEEVALAAGLRPR